MQKPFEKLNRSLRFFLIFILIASTSSCALFRTSNTQAPSINIGNNRLTLPKPQALNLDLQASQILSATYQIKGEKDHISSEVYLEINAHKIIMVAAAGWGGTIFTIDYNGATINSSSLPMPNAQMGVTHTLLDFILTYAPKNTIYRMLKGTDMNVQFSEKKRIYLLNEKPFIYIHYSNKDPWCGTVTLKNTLYDYQIHIQTLNMNTEKAKN